MIFIRNVRRARKFTIAAPPMSLLLCGLLCLEPAWTAAGQDAPTPKINIVIVDGDGAINNVRQRTAREPIVQVEDENHRPVAGAAVLFTLPSRGASGVFADGSRTFTTVTDSQGRAVARGITTNRTAGQMQIRVDVSYRGQTASRTINQTNQLARMAKPAISSKVLIIVAVVAAAAVGGTCAAAFCRGGGSTTPAQSPGAVISAGGGTVGGPPR